MTALKLTQPEQRIASEVMSGFDDLPDWLQHRIAIYSKMLHQWNLTSAKISGAHDLSEKYKLVQMCAMLSSQMRDSAAVIDRERERQRDLRANAEGEDPGGVLGAIWNDGEGGDEDEPPRIIKRPTQVG